MNRRLRIRVNIVLGLVLAVGLAVLLGQQVRWHGLAEARDLAARTAGFFPPEDPDRAPQALAELDLEALQAVNGDVAGWIYVPGTEIAYPLLQGQDNDYYLRHTWEGKWNSGGSIFLDRRCAPDFGDFHTIVYGHRMDNGTMFAPLLAYREADFWREHPDLYVAAGDAVYRYEIFAAWEPGVDSGVFASVGDELSDRQAFVELCLGSSEIDAGVVPGPEDRILTLSTCTESGHETRWVVQARLTEAYGDMGPAPTVRKHPFDKEDFGW